MDMHLLLGNCQNIKAILSMQNVREDDKQELFTGILVPRGG